MCTHRLRKDTGFHAPNSHEIKGKATHLTLNRIYIHVILAVWIEDFSTNIFHLEVIPISESYHVEIRHHICRIL